MMITALSRVDTSMIELVGGKAARLGEMVQLGEPVPDGFCLTTEVHASGSLASDAVLEAYRE